jgi:hypothetical protein
MFLIVTIMLHYIGAAFGWTGYLIESASFFSCL